MLKKISVSLIIILIITSLFFEVNAAEEKITLDVLVRESEKEYFENDQGNVSKSVVEKDEEKGEVTIELKVSNEKKSLSSTEPKGTEVIFVIDNSVSMEDKVNGTEKSRRDLVISAAKEFTSKLYKDIDNLQVGALYYYGYNNSTFESVGNEHSVKMLSSLTKDEAKIQKALTDLSTAEYNYGTNTQAGLKKAQSMFSKDKNKQRYIILLSDGVPNHAIGVPLGVSETLTEEERNEQIRSKTVETLIEIKQEDINLITILTGIGDLESESDKRMLESVFGTEENPQAGLLYNIEDADIEKIIEEEIYSKLVGELQNPITTVKVVDYFPEDIIDNFEFSYVGNPSNGTVNGKSLDPSTKTITWYIDSIKGNENATLRYKLKIKDMNNKDLMNKVISTNEKVIVSYTDKEKKDYTVTLSSSPKIRLTKRNATAEPTTKPTRSPSTGNSSTGGTTRGNSSIKDPTTAEGKYPYAGAQIVLIGLLGTLVASIIIYVKYSSYKDVK